MSYLKHPFSSAIRQQVKPYMLSNNWSGLLAVFKDYSIILLAAYLCTFSYFWLPVSVLFIGSRQRALTALLHHASHGSLARSRRLNRVMGNYLVGYPIFQNLKYYRKVHIPHHSYLGSPDKDTDRMAQVDSGLAGVSNRKEFFEDFFLKQALMLGVWGFLKYLFATRVCDFLKSERDRYGLLVSHFVLFVILTAMHGVFGYVLFWLLPFVTVSLVLGWFLELCEHFGLYERETHELKMSRNRFPSWWERLFFGHHNEVYHLTHHLFPTVPSWHLSTVHRILMSDIQYQEANAGRGGMVSAPKGRVSILTEIMNGLPAKN